METQQKIEELVRVGLKADQAEIYVTLLKRSQTTASKLATFTSLTRPLVYKVLDELIQLNLVEKIEETASVTRFSTTHPLKLREFIDQKKSEVEQKNTALEGVLSQLVSDFNTMNNRPGVRILQGLSGIDELYEDILNENQSISLIRSPLDDHFPELYAKVLEQIRAQVAAGISTRAITPFVDETMEELEQVDPKNLVTRRLVNVDTFNIPAQILVYADKVAITAFDNELMTTIIQNQSIANTFLLTFEFIWQSLKKEDAEIRKKLAAGTLTPPQKPAALPPDHLGAGEHS